MRKCTPSILRILAVSGLVTVARGGTPLQIVSEPADAVVTQGSNIELTLLATGSPAPSYQWALNGEPIPGAVGPTLTLQDIQPGDCGSYSAFVQNEFETIQSDPAAINVSIPVLPFSDSVARRGVLRGTSGVGRGNNATAKTDLLEPWGLLAGVKHSVWASWTAPQSGVVTFSTVGSGFDTVLGGFSVTTLPLLPPILLPMNIDDESGGYHTSQVTFNVEGGEEYAIGVGWTHQEGGSIVLSWQFQAGQSAPLILLQPLSQTINFGQSASLVLSVQSLLPVLFQWFKDDVAIPGANASRLNIANATSADVGLYHCRLSVLGITLLSSDAELQINTEGLKAGARNRLSDALAVGIKGKSLSAMGKMRAMDISGSAGYSGSQVFKTAPGKDPGEPNACGVAGGASDRLAYTAPATGVLTMNTDGSSFDTVLAVYVDNGSNQGYPSLVSVACDNNSGSDGRDSKVVFNVSANRTYYVQIDGVSGATGTVYLNYNLSYNVNRAPVANTDGGTCRRLGTVAFYISSLLSNDSDPDGDALGLYSFNSTSNFGGKITRSGNYLYYTPPSSLSAGASDYFSYNVTDNRGAYASARVFITITQ